MDNTSQVGTQAQPWAPPLHGQQRFALIQAGWHLEIVDEGCRSFISEMVELGIREDQIDRFTVPGSFEIPLHVKLLANSRRYAAIVGCGFVVDGGIYRHEFVAEAVISGLMSVGLETGIPVLSMVLTPIRFHEHGEHLDFFKRHFAVKGKEAAQACVAAVDSLNKVRSVTDGRKLEAVSRV